jgi:hypothetical protein
LLELQQPVLRVVGREPAALETRHHPTLPLD